MAVLRLGKDLQGSAASESGSTTIVLQEARDNLSRDAQLWRSGALQSPRSPFLAQVPTPLLRLAARSYTPSTGTALPLGNPYLKALDGLLTQEAKTGGSKAVSAKTVGLDYRLQPPHYCCLGTGASEGVSEGEPFRQADTFNFRLPSPAHLDGKAGKRDKGHHRR